jgi:hypothetical protein
MGRPEEDVGEALAYLLDADPMFTDKKIGIGLKFIERYERGSGIALSGIEGYVARSLWEAAVYRPGQAKLLLKKAAEIEGSGIFTPGPR